MEARRLFVGGLHSDTTEEILRSRFKSFGSVSSVEIIHRKDETGTPIKTFAYVNIGITEGSLKKCLSILNNSKWKGNLLKIQVAKQSFLTRLHEERIELHKNAIGPKANEAKDNGGIAEKSSTLQKSHIGAATPGTLVEGTRNWVVGKFGRVLPIVFLRRRDGKKIAKFDPSQTIHCLKKIKDTEESRSVSELTWELEDKERPVSKAGKMSCQQDCNGKRVNGSPRKGESCDRTPLKKRIVPRDNKTENEALLEGRPVNGSDMRKRETGEMQVEGRESLGVDAWGIDDGDSDDDDDDEDEDKEERTDEGSSDADGKEEEEKGDIGGQSDNVDGNENEDYSGEDESTDDTGDNDSSSDSNYAGSVEGNEALVTGNDRSTLKKSKLHVDGKIAGVGSHTRNCNLPDLYSSPKQDITQSENQNNLEPEVSGSVDQKGAPTVLHRPASEQKFDSNLSSSNAKRLDALKKRQDVAKSQKSLIKDALQNVDRKKTEAGGSNHILFEDEDDLENEKKQEETTSNKKVLGSEASSWLGLDSEGGLSADDEVENADLFSVKKHFEGKAGEKLFRLQKSFGGDERFKLDRTFLDSDDDSTDAEQSGPINVDSQPDEPECDSEGGMDLTKEKEMYLSVLQRVLDKEGHPKSKLNTNAGREFFRDMSTLRYDPTNENHKDFERKEVQEALTTELTEEIETQTAPEEPDVSGEKFYDVDTSLLSNLFGKQKQDQVSSPFTFFGGDPECAEETNNAREIGDAEDFKFKQWKPQHLPYDSSDSDNEDQELEEEESSISNLNANTEAEQFFFFHVDDPELKNRLWADDQPFMRTMSEEQLSEHWVSVRSELTQDYKRKHKDAVRRQRKMASKRAKLE